MKTVEELKKEAQEEMTHEKEEQTKSRIKNILYNIADVQRDITCRQERLSKYQKELTEFKV